MNFLNLLARNRDLIFPIAIIACVGVILVPLPPLVMDILLTANIAISVVILLTTISIRTPLEFSVFPSLLVATTLARLVLNVATTRLILSRSDRDALGAAGGVIQAFGEFVAGDRMVVGVILFVIIIIIQFIVITKGATRVSEVAARFALDGMPGRQMSIDADLNSGAINEAEAQRRRAQITSQADFFGAMDGASKFVRGDAIAGIIITIINIVGGIYVGMAFANLSFEDSVTMFAKLTIGDGLVSQVPALLISLAAALLVTRSSQQTNLPLELLNQLFARPQALAVAGAFLGLLTFTQLPTIPLLTLGSGCVGLAFMVNKEQKQAKIREAEASKNAAAEKAKAPEKKAEDFLEIDPMRVEIGGALLPLADPRRGGDLMDRISSVRSILASELGILLPKVRLKDKLQLPEAAYEIQIAGNIVARGEVHPNRLLAIDTGNCTGVISGIETREPTAGRPAVWITPEQKVQASLYNYQVATPSAVIATHLQEISRRHADELLTRDATKQLIEQLKATSPTVVDELIPGLMKLSEVQTILRMLLREDVSIRQLGTILETLGDNVVRTKGEPVRLTEYVRQRLGRTICQRFSDSAGQLHVITMNPAMEDRIAKGGELTDHGPLIRMSPEVIDITVQQIAAQLRLLTQAGHKPILLVRHDIRPILRILTQNTLPDLRIISHIEISRQTTAISVGMVSDPVSKA